MTTSPAGFFETCVERIDGFTGQFSLLSKQRGRRLFEISVCK